ncbi:hypothetical protein JF544_12655 [Halobacillus kuroshimensis]|uniref:Uncharacterized protein n=1 Tax=Halobacillus kuroshimensis TaxID=302481 RepID=A0ABS3DXL7_9BACI|nr:hypothetical protein [Halobacillus kuroshimensis]MBN8236107.1 hypothetical protein [Halobacillus kuroshimensis]
MNVKKNLIRVLSIVISITALVFQNLSLFSILEMSNFLLTVFTWIFPIVSLVLGVISFSINQNKKDVITIALAVFTLFYSLIFVGLAWILIEIP